MPLKIKKTDIFLIIFYLVLEFLFLGRIPDVMIDEPWYSNTAYNFVHQLRFTNTNVWHSGGDLFCLTPFMVAVFFKVFGFSFYVSRLSSVIAGLIALLGMIRLMRFFEIRDRNILFAGSLLIFSNIFYVISRTVRPEIWVIALGVWSLYFSLRYFFGREMKFCFYAGILAGLGILAHPEGFLQVLNAGIIILIAAIKERKFLPFISYGLTMLIVFFLPVIYCLQNPEYEIEFLKDEILNRNSATADAGLLSNVVNFINLYTLGIKRLYILLFEIGVLVSGIFLLKGELKWFPLLGLMTFGMGFILFSPFNSRSFGQILVYSVFTFALLINTVGRIHIKRFLAFAGLLYLLNNIAGDIYMLFIKQNNISYDKIAGELNNLIPDKKRVASILSLWYAFPENEFCCEYSRWEKRELTGVSELIRTEGMDYIVLSDFMVSGQTGTSGRNVTVSKNKLDYYNDLLHIASDNGELIHELDAGNYGKIRIWKMARLQRGD